MKTLGIALLILSVCFTSLFAQGNSPDPTDTITDDSSSDTPSTADTTTKPDTPKTTEPATKDATTGTDPEPPVTTKVPATTDSPTTNPPTTEPPHPTTTLAPKIVPGNWTVKDNETDTICILATFKAKFEIHYTFMNKSAAVETIEMPANATVTEGSTCNGDGHNNSEILDLEFLAMGYSHSLNLVFTNGSSKVLLQNITLTINRMALPDSNETTEMDYFFSAKLFSTNEGHSFICSKDTVVKSTAATITFSAVQVEAYRNTKDDTKFNLAENCDNDLGNIVPIAVGCALAALVVIVLIAYLVGRRHKRQRGYESV